jgi:hypothetical protein
MKQFNGGAITTSIKEALQKKACPGNCLKNINLEAKGKNSEILVFKNEMFC